MDYPIRVGLELGKAALKWPIEKFKEYVTTYKDIKPELIVNLTNKNQPVFHHETFKEIIHNGSAEDLPILMVAVTGKWRSGKSFLLNLMVTYFMYRQKHSTDDLWEDSDEPIMNGGWQRSADGVTRGIWMWNRPFVISINYSKVAVLLVDCEGIGDCQHSDKTYDNLIMYLGLQLSNVTILNTQSMFSADDLRHVEICTNYAGILAESHKHLFGSLIFLVRDYQQDDRYGDKRELFLDTLTGDVSHATKAINSSFAGYKTVFALPEPGKKVKRASDVCRQQDCNTASANKPDIEEALILAAQDGTILSLKDIDEEFMAHAKVLFQLTFGRATESLTLLTGSEVIENFRILEVRIKGFGNNLNLSGADALQESILYQALEEIQDDFQNDMEKLIEVTTTEEALTEEFNTLMVNLRQKFNENPSVIFYCGNRENDITRKYKDKLEKFINDKEKKDLRLALQLKRFQNNPTLDEAEKTKTVAAETNETESDPIFKVPKEPWYKKFWGWFCKELGPFVIEAAKVVVKLAILALKESAEKR